MGSEGRGSCKFRVVVVVAWCIMVSVLVTINEVTKLLNVGADVAGGKVMP